MWKEGGLSLDTLHAMTPGVDSTKEQAKMTDENSGGEGGTPKGATA